MSEPTEADFERLLAKLKARDPNFDTHVEKGRLMLQKRADELTPTERAFLDGDHGKQN